MAFDKQEYQKKYNKEHWQDRKDVRRRFQINFHNIYDIEMIHWIDSQENMQGYIKSLIVADMDRHNAERIRGNKDEEQ